MNKQEQERRAKLMRMQAERLPEIKRRFEENQNRSNFEKTEEKPNWGRGNFWTGAKT